MSIPVDARGFLMKHRDGWKAEHGVTVWFPRHERFGSFQTMYMSGTTSAMAAVKRKVLNVLAEAESERAAYLERKQRRERRHVSGSWYRPVSEKKTITVSQPVNLFRALESIGDEDMTPKAVGSKRDEPVPHGPTPCKPRALQGCWAQKVEGTVEGSREEAEEEGWGPIVGAWGDDE